MCRSVCVSVPPAMSSILYDGLSVSSYIRFSSPKDEITCEKYLARGLGTSTVRDVGTSHAGPLLNVPRSSNLYQLLPFFLHSSRVYLDLFRNICSDYYRLWGLEWSECVQNPTLGFSDNSWSAYSSSEYTSASFFIFPVSIEVVPYLGLLVAGLSLQGMGSAPGQSVWDLWWTH